MKGSDERPIPSSVTEAAGHRSPAEVAQRYHAVDEILVRAREREIMATGIGAGPAIDTLSAEVERLRRENEELAAHCREREEAAAALEADLAKARADSARWCQQHESMAGFLEKMTEAHDRARAEKAAADQALLEARAELDKLRADADRYARLRVLGCAPGGSPHLEDGNVLCFTNLDAYVDTDIAAHPSRGEARRG